MIPGLPIADYALLSDSNSAALVSRAGSVDWLCLPRFDGPSVLARVLDEEAGHWVICPEGPHDVRRRYLPGTLVLETQFDTPHGRAMVTDALLFGDGERGHEIGTAVPHALARVVEVTRGSVVIEASFAPRPEYGIVRPRLLALDGAVVARGGAQALVLSGPAPDLLAGAKATWRVELAEGDRLAFVLQHGVAWQVIPEAWTTEEIERRLADTIDGWRSWSEQHQSYDGPWREQVQHSGRILQALTFQPTGAVIAAPTTSLPESVGGGRNWDYRYAWIRDASMALRALWVAACPDEAGRFVEWLVTTTGSGADRDGDLQIVYGVGGEHDLSERELPHLAGWRGSRPVRVGNGAWDQHQLDIGGELLDAVHRLRETIGELDAAGCELLNKVADASARRWVEPDQGIWEVRGEPRHHVHSKLMCWVALDRAVDLADWLHATEERTAAWTSARDHIRRVILEEGWNPEIGAFTQVLGGEELDAAVLLMAITGFLPVDDEKMRSTIDRIAAELSAPCGLLWRYKGGDDIDEDEATFLVCTYWLVECYAMAGRVEEAQGLFERATAYANDVGLLAEEVEPTTGELLGNFPQAYSHVGLINAAWALAQAGVAPTVG